MTHSSPKNIIISHVYSSDNKGDAALTSVLIKDLRRTFKNASITILKLEAVKKNAHFEGVPEQPGFMYYALNKYRNPLIKLVYTLYMMSATLLWAAWPGMYLPPHLRHVAKLYQRADLIVPVGGGYIRSRPGLMHRLNIPLLLHPLLFGYMLGKPTVLYSQSVGPFQNKLEELMVSFVLKRMTCILLREDTSLILLANMGVIHNAVRAIDAGFLLTSPDKVNIRKEYDIPAGALLIGVTVRAWLKGKAQTHYEKAVAKALDNVIDASGAHVIFIPQVTAAKGDDDRLVSRRVHDFMHHKNAATVITTTPNHHRIKAMYNNLDILLGTRFHSVIFSLTSLVPVLAIEYEHKTSGIMHDLYLDDWVIKIEEVTAKNLTQLLRKLVWQQSEYRTHLRKHLPAYQRQARRAIKIVAEAVEQPDQAITM